MSWFDDDDKELLFVYDDGSSISCLNNDMLFLPDSILSVSPIKVRNSSDLYSRINRSGEAYGLGRVYFDCEQFVSILCAHDIEEGINFVVTEQKNSAGKRYGYDIFLKEIGVTLHARWHNRIMMGSFKPLLDFIRRGSVSIERTHDEMFLLSSTKSSSGAKASTNLRTLAKTETAAVLEVVDYSDIFDKMSFTTTQRRESVFWLNDVVTGEDSQFSFAVKKEVPYSKALLQFDSEKVEQSMVDELTGLVTKWHPVFIRDVPADERKSILPGQALVKEKNLGLDSILKGRFVAGGHRQDITDYDIYREVSTPTAGLSSLFSVAAYAAAKGLAVGSFDAKQAYLKAPMPKSGRRIRVRLTKAIVELIKSISEELRNQYDVYEDDNGSVIVELDFALYGCLESGRLWYEHFKKILLKMSYKMSSYDDCVFNMFDDGGLIVSTIVIHVDDGFVTGTSEEILDVFFEKLRAELGDLKIKRGREHEYLGMMLDFQQSNVVHITIEKLIHNLIADWSVSKTRNTPARPDLFEVDEDSAVLDSEISKKLHRGIAQLLYLSTHVRPDVLCATIFLTSRVQKLTQQDLSKFMDILSYLNGTISLGIMLGGDKSNRIGLFAYADASFGIHMDGKSHGGTFISYGRGPNLARSNKLKDVSISSSESELMQLTGTTSLAVRERNFAIEQQHIDSNEQGLLLEDNKSSIHMANNGKSISNRTRHIKVKYFFVKQFLDSGEFRLEHCPTKEMIADILTKPLQGELFLELRDLLLGYEALSR